MRKIIILSMCIILWVLLCVWDGTKQKEIQKQNACMVMAEPEETIRVLVKTAGFESEYHKQITLSSKGRITVSDGREKQTYQPGTMLEFRMQDDWFETSEVLFLESEADAFVIKNLQRDRMEETYEGRVEIRKTKEGLLLINELPLERYLCGVIPSEMPSSYPQEALKAQAVCARTYARKQKKEKREEEYFADVDDSVSFQVYNNQDRAETTDQAVENTKHIVLLQEGELAETLYYSTSCGQNTQLDLSEESIFASFLSADPLTAYEAQEPWFRWNTWLSLKEQPDIQKLQIVERSPKGAVEKLQVEKRNGDACMIKGEYEVRAFLAGFHPVITLQNGEKREGVTLLPSAFLLLQPEYENGILCGYQVWGGGYGHGIGMSQNGAKEMAKTGKNWKEILQRYFPDAQIQTDETGPACETEAYMIN